MSAGREASYRPRFDLRAGAIRPSGLAVDFFHGVEELSRPFRFVVGFSTDIADTLALTRDLVGQPACLRLSAGEAGERVVCGVVRRVELEGRPGEGASRRSGKLWLAPRLRLLGDTRRSRIFQDRTVQEIVDAVLGEAGVERRWVLLRTYGPRVYCVQHEESDLAFVSRILAEEGISYTFEHAITPAGDGKETVLLLDSAHAYEPIDGEPKIRFRDDQDAPGEHVGGFAIEERLRLGATQLRARAEAAHGESGCSRLVPGRWFALAGHPISGLDRRWAVSRVTHEARDGYHNRFTCVPAEIAWRPRRPRPRRQQVLETATVVGPEGHEVHTDALGRVKVRFHWDFEGEENDHASCWIRVMQAWAGAGWGFQFIPRVGMEVVVSFVHGDTDLPMVLGSAYDAEHAPPFALPGNKTKSGIRTRTYRGEGYNELSFEDRKGHERVFLHAGKDLAARVENDQTTSVGGNQTDHVTGNRFEVVDRNRTASVGGRQTVDVAGDNLQRTGGDHVIETRGLTSETVGSIDAPSGADFTVWGHWNASASRTVYIRAEQSIILECGRTRVVLGHDGVRLETPSLRVVHEDAVYVLDQTGALVPSPKDGDST